MLNGPDFDKEQYSFSDYPDEYWNVPNAAIFELIQVNVHAATTYIDRTRDEYKIWAKDHNSTLDDGNPVNLHDNFESKNSDDSTRRISRGV